MELDQREIEIIECLFMAWTNDDMPLYGGMSCQCVFDLMEKLGIDPSEGKAVTAELEKKISVWED
jgi:hypothetical protein